MLIDQVELINKIDGKINPLLEPINNLIDEIKATYDQRIVKILKVICIRRNLPSGQQNDSRSRYCHLCL